MTEMPERPVLLRIGDYAGFCEYVGKWRKQKASEKTWRLMQVTDGLNSSDVILLGRVRVDLYRPLVRSIQFVPRSKLSHSQRRQSIRPVREKIAPFFPGYAFFSFPESDERWRDVFKMVGIRGLVCCNNQPVDVPWELISEIQAREVNGAVPSDTKISEFAFLIGENVRINDGAFAGFTGTVTGLPKQLDGIDLGDVTLDQLDDSLRVDLLVDIFGRPSRVELGLSEIEKV